MDNINSNITTVTSILKHHNFHIVQSVNGCVYVEGRREELYPKIRDLQYSNFWVYGIPLFAFPGSSGASYALVISPGKITNWDWLHYVRNQMDVFPPLLPGTDVSTQSTLTRL